MTVFSGQTALRIRITDLGDLTGYGEILIKYKLNTRTATEAEWTATVEDATEGIIYYDLTTADELESGVYSVWPHITWSDGRISIGIANKLEIKQEGLL